ncbi:MAG: hypothetical protein PHV34_16065 [Verrucomicrobiae bacterium]|nr:hypothetical protein [Verrucomicrobiae bacterium]
MRKAWKYLSRKNLKTIAAQKNAVIDLIRAGRENGVESMTIKLDQTIGLDLGAEVDGIPVRLKAGEGGCVVLNVKYGKDRGGDVARDESSRLNP